MASVESRIYIHIYVLFFISDPAARSFAGRIVSAEVFAAAQQKLSAQKREPKPKPKKKKENGEKRKILAMESQERQDDGENMAKVPSMRRYNNSRVNNNNNSHKATMSAV